MDLQTTRQVVHEGLRVVVGPASYKMGLYHTILAEQARKEQSELNPDDPALLAVVIGTVMIWPSLIAAVVEHDGFEHWPPTPAELLELPDPFVTEWEQAAYAVNPQWVAKPPEAETGPKAPNG